MAHNPLSKLRVDLSETQIALNDPSPGFDFNDCHQKNKQKTGKGETSDAGECNKTMRSCKEQSKAAPCIPLLVKRRRGIMLLRSYQADGQTCPNAFPFLFRVVIYVRANGHAGQGDVQELPNTCDR